MLVRGVGVSLVRRFAQRILQSEPTEGSANREGDLTGKPISCGHSLAKRKLSRRHWYSSGLLTALVPFVRAYPSCSRAFDVATSMRETSCSRWNRSCYLFIDT